MSDEKTCTITDLVPLNTSTSQVLDVTVKCCPLVKGITILVPPGGVFIRRVVTGVVTRDSNANTCHCILNNLPDCKHCDCQTILEADLKL